MEIKGRYEENQYNQELKRRQEEANKSYGPKLVSYEIGITAGEFLNKKTL